MLVKKEYSKPEIEIVEIKQSDIVTKSGFVDLPFDPFMLD